MTKRVFFKTSFLGLVLSLFISVTIESHASTEVWETMGISTGAGMILGTSTLPFYSKPTDHAANIAYGTIAGATIGLGVWLYHQWFGFNSNRTVLKDGNIFRKQRSQSFFYKRRSISPSQPWFPLVSLNW